MTDLYSEQKTGMRFSAFPLLVPHKNVPGRSGGADLIQRGLPGRNPLKGKVAGKGMGLATKGLIPERCV